MRKLLLGECRKLLNRELACDAHGSAWRTALAAVASADRAGSAARSHLSSAASADRASAAVLSAVAASEGAGSATDGTAGSAVALRRLAVPSCGSGITAVTDAGVASAAHKGPSVGARSPLRREGALAVQNPSVDTVGCSLGAVQTAVVTSAELSLAPWGVRRARRRLAGRVSLGVASEAVSHTHSQEKKSRGGRGSCLRNESARDQ